ncbi:hypothetical protein Snoj_33020 [Streptomyces nojiriensis]|uniref:DUF4232 domain-containing protein n=1 Tax=Streptomyces nojiriensis TaxID=66374 RepID=A0ABQ3SMN0_9ACTN|nr:DUF4232 domain-containing protein [Streptomyces nojiriensis]QTI42953.1 hypothetical protein JYK04_00714 [Streptomyces nojiriensis]GGS33015.1 hypothetical protein GCM10010205_73990 [Streptomyces nojiriensis]GHI69384.1 hypothetical protein Snoj_33020 [Streptomyces nojiriensis]
MRVHQLTLAAVAVAASLSLTACQNGADGAAQSTPSASSTASAPSTASPSGGGSDQGGGKPPQGTGSGGKGTAGAGTGSDASGKVGKCRTDELAITAAERTIGGDTDGTVAVTLKNSGARDCTISGYAGIDLKTDSGSLSAQRTGQQADTAVLKKGESTYFGISYPLNTSGGSGVRVTGLVVTPPDETRSVTLAWPGAGTLPVTEGGGAPVKVGPVGSAGQGG